MSTAARGSTVTRGRRMDRWQMFERAIELTLLACAVLSIGTTVGIIAVLAVETVAFLREVPVLDFLFGTQWTPLFAAPRFGVLRSRCWPPLATGR